MGSVELNRENYSNVDGQLARNIKDTLFVMKALKPGDRSEKDRYYAIAITELEKVYAFFSTYCVDS